MAQCDQARSWKLEVSGNKLQQVLDIAENKAYRKPSDSTSMLGDSHTIPISLIASQVFEGTPGIDVKKVRATR